MPAFFISDIHLHPTRQKTAAQLLGVFQRMINEKRVGEPSQLFLLGDIFDAWVGDDDPEPLWQQIRNALIHLKEAGFSIYWMAGNRDFLVGPDFMLATGCQALSEPAAMTLEGGHCVVLLHGDLLCTQDKSYQRFRCFVRHPWVLWLYRHLPLAIRLGIARQLRQLSRPLQKQKTIPLSLGYAPPKKSEAGERDEKTEGTQKYTSAKEWINEATSDALLLKHEARTLIHGHIHCSGIHNRTLTDSNGKTRRAQRIVLGDWDAGPSVLVFDAGEFYFRDF
jgi:UDP-2,3-diacylglucosamine hydrolase